MPPKPPLQNRVAPDGSLHAVPERGTMLGNRGGKFHRDDKTLGKRRWATHHWICCELHYKDAHHDAMGRGYTSLFFLDEVTALAAGHRPCFLCRRKEAKAFLGGEKVESFDCRLHAERLTPSPLWGGSGRGSEGGAESAQTKPSSAGATPTLNPSPQGGGKEFDLPDGCMVADNTNFYAKRGRHLLLWSFSGYTSAIPIRDAKILTPPSILAILTSGYQPRWHPSALQWDDT